MITAHYEMEVLKKFANLHTSNTSDLCSYTSNILEKTKRHLDHREHFSDTNRND